MKPSPSDDAETLDLLEISIRSLNRLQEETGITTSRDLMRVGQRTLRLLKLGDKCVDEIASAFLERYGVELPQAGDPSELASIAPPLRSKLEAVLHLSKTIEDLDAKK